MSAITREEFQMLLEPVTDFIGERILDETLEHDLNNEFPATGQQFMSIEEACHMAIQDGWMCKYEGDGIKYGRVIKPIDKLKGFSVDVVDMEDARGPHHKHPKGEIDLIMPIKGDAKFDGKGAGWKIFKAGSAHYPTVSGGRALVLYLLPGGEIEFTGS